jgi:DNA mismatch endonuclease (patch repair protein)
MADRITGAQRSKVMSKVRSKDTAIELYIRSALHRRGFRFRKNVSDLPGKPDVVLPKYKCVIFIHGCFWHQHAGCKRATVPQTRVEFWTRKLTGNVERDKLNQAKLQTQGWRVLTVWECSLRSVTEEEKNSFVSNLATLIVK